MKAHRAGWLLGLFLAMASGPAEAREFQIAVASNFHSAMKIIAADFAEQTGHRAIVSYGATGRFYAQIRQGAPFDVLLAADAAIPARLETEGLAVPGMRDTYALGRLVLWSPSEDAVDTSGNVLWRGRFERIALANPKLAPYGAAAVEAVSRMGLLTDLQSKFVQGENIAQTFHFVSTGNVELGFVALSQVFDHGRLKSGSGWIVPAAWHDPIRQDAVLLKHGTENPAARAFMEYLQGDAAQAVIKSFGYEAG